MRIFFPFWRYFIIFLPSPLRNGCDCRGPASHNHGEATVLKMKINSEKGKDEDIAKDKCSYDADMKIMPRITHYIRTQDAYIVNIVSVIRGRHLLGKYNINDYNIYL